MSKDELFALLADLGATRRLSSETEALLDPFRGKKYLLPLTFISSSNTFANRFDDAYTKGKTVICKMGEMEAAVLLPPDENDVVDSLAAGQVFEREVTLLDFDTLYQRGIFGQFIEETTEAEPQQDTSQEVEETPPEAVVEATVETPPAEAPQEPPAEAPKEPVAPSPEPVAKSPTPEKAAPPKAPPDNQLKKKTKRKEGKIKHIGRKPKPSRFAKLKQTKLFRIKDKIAKKIKHLKRTPCPNGHGPLSYYYKGKMYCKVCGWPRRDWKPSAKPSGDSSLARGWEGIETPFKCGCISIIVIFLFILFLTLIRF